VETVKYFTQEQLVAANAKAKAHKGRHIAKLPPLDSDHKFPITTATIHNDREMRVFVVLNGEGLVGALDVDLKTYNNLPEVQVPTYQ
jgi:hypothetical protein